MRALAILILLASPVAFAAPVPKELKKVSLIGTWEVTSVDVRGTATDAFNGQRWKFEKGQYSLQRVSNQRGGIRADAGKFEVADEVEGKLELTSTESTAKKYALFQAEGESLRLGYVVGGKEVPDDFKSGSDRVIYTMKRVKE